MAKEISQVYALIQHLPEGTWAAVSEATMEILAFGEDAVAVFREAQAKGEAVPLMLKAPAPGPLITRLYIGLGV